MPKSKLGPVLNLGGDAVLKPTGLDLLRQVSEDRYREIGSQLCCIDRGIQWALGDWYVLGNQIYGERAEAIAVGIFGGRARHTLQNYAAVCRALAASRRREGLSFGHHEAVVALPEEVQEDFFNTAEKQQLSVQDLRDAATRWKKENQPARGAFDPSSAPLVMQVPKVNSVTEKIIMSIPSIKGERDRVRSDTGWRADYKSAAQEEFYQSVESFSSPTKSAQAASLSIRVREFVTWMDCAAAVMDSANAALAQQLREGLERQLTKAKSEAELENRPTQSQVH
jgi:hypothetical protein